MLSVRKHTVNPATSGYNRFVIVACDANAEDGDQDADELDRGFCVPGHGDCNYLMIRGTRIEFTI